jgi:hypothetical protein
MLDLDRPLAPPCYGASFHRHVAPAGRAAAELRQRRMQLKFSGSSLAALSLQPPSTMHPHVAISVRRTLGRSSLALLIAVAACGDNGTTRDSTPEGVLGQSATPAPAAPAVTSTQMEMRISGGQFAGTHQATDNVACTLDQDTWMVTSSRPGDQGLTQVLLMVDGVQPTGGSSREVSLMATFGDPMRVTSPNAGSISVDPVGEEGTGSGTVRREGRAAVIEVDGTTGDGDRVSLVVRCESVSGLL